MGKPDELHLTFLAFRVSLTCLVGGSYSLSQLSVYDGLAQHSFSRAVHFSRLQENTKLSWVSVHSLGPWNLVGQQWDRVISAFTDLQGSPDGWENSPIIT